MENRWIVLFLPLIVVTLSGWFWSEKKEAPPPVIGIWKSISNDQLMKLSFNSIGLFKADFVDENLMDITGEYRVFGDQVILSDDRTTSDTGCRDKAYYYFKVINSELKLTLIADSCSPRRAILPGHWQLISNPEMEKKKRKKQGKAEPPSEEDFVIPAK